MHSSSSICFYHKAIEDGVLKIIIDESSHKKLVLLYAALMLLFQRQKSELLIWVTLYNKRFVPDGHEIFE